MVPVTLKYSGADIPAASKEVLGYLNKHVDNLVPSQMVPTM